MPIKKNFALDVVLGQAKCTTEVFKGTPALGKMDGIRICDSRDNRYNRCPFKNCCLYCLNYDCEYTKKCSHVAIDRSKEPV